MLVKSCKYLLLDERQIKYVDAEMQIKYTFNLTFQIIVPFYSVINMNKILVTLLFHFYVAFQY